MPALCSSSSASARCPSERELGVWLLILGRGNFLHSDFSGS